MLVIRIPAGSQAPSNHALVAVRTSANKTLYHRSIVLESLRCSQQIRAFRLGLWSSYLDPSFHKELQRRHRVMKHKYAEAVNRKLSWDRHHPRYAARLNLKSFMCSAWKGQDPRPAGRWMDSDELRNMKKEKPRDDGHWDLVDQIFRGRHGVTSASWLPSQVKWTTATKMDSRPSHYAAAGNSPEHDHGEGSSRMANLTQEGDSISQTHYDIDPITNRRVYRKNVSHRAGTGYTSITVQTFKGHQSESNHQAQDVANSKVDCGQHHTIYLDEARPSATANADTMPGEGDHNDSKAGEARSADTASTRPKDDSAKIRLSPEDSSLDTPVDYHTGMRSSIQGRPNTIEPAPSRFSNILKRSDISAAEREEDLDLMTAESIRARSQHLKVLSKESSSARNARRDVLETSFAKTHQESLSRSEDTAARQKVKQCKARAQELEIERSELLNHNAHAQGKVDAKIAELQAEMEDMDRNQGTAKARKVTGSFTRDFPEEFAKTWARQGVLAHDPLLPRDETYAETDAWGYTKVPTGLEVSYQQEKEHATRLIEDQGLGNLEIPVDSKSSKTGKLQPSLDRLESKDEKQRQVEVDPYTKIPLGLETSYIDECTANRDPNPAVIHTSYGGEKPMADLAGTAAQAKKEKKRKDKELIREVRNIYESTYGTIDCKHRHKTGDIVRDDATLPVNSIADIEDGTRAGQYFINDWNLEFAKIAAENGARQMRLEKESQESPVPATSTAPTSYYIVAYEPRTQTFTTLEATSTIAEASPPQSLTEVLLRLASPAKFFPHIRELQEKGYELLSGNGDVLVFLKRRGSVMDTSHKTESSPVNPIDGMVASPRPTTGNFASPTGFVNHDMPDMPTPFRSGIDVRREEPVFSGRGTGWQADESKKQSGTGRRLLIGAAWLAACSYAVGVVTVFFRTGGADGLGPSGM